MGARSDGTEIYEPFTEQYFYNIRSPLSLSWVVKRSAIC